MAASVGTLSNAIGGEALAADSDSPPGGEMLERFGGTLEQHQGIFVAQLRGSYADMGRQHMALANETCGDVVPRYLDGLIEKLIAHAAPLAAAPAGALLKRLFRFRNLEHIAPGMRELMRSAADEAGMPPRAFESIFLVPDIVHWLAGKSFVPLAVPPMCSTFYAAGGATEGGRQLFARNFDFFGRNVWNACNALVVMHPRDGQRICWIGALGSPSAPQGINESGLIFGLNTLFTRDVSTHGQPIFTLCQKLMAECATLDEAVRAIDAQPRMIGMAVTIADSKARAAASIEFSARKLRVVEMKDGTVLRTNHYLKPDMQEDEVAPYPWQLNSRGRYRRISGLLQARRGSLAAAHCPAILSDCMDVWEEQERVTGNVVACINTTQSMVASHDDDALWLARGDNPVSHAREYTGFRLSALFDGDTIRYTHAPLAGGSTLSETQRATVREYAQAWTEHFDNLNDDQAVFHLRRAAGLLPGEAIFPRMAGILLLRQKRYAQALPLLERNAAFETRNVLMRAESFVWVGRCLDLMGRRSEALEHYRKAAALEAPPVSEAATRHLTKPFRRLDLLEVAPEFVCGTAIARYRKN